ncbi:MAG TPA: methyltransferase domain-containing protein [Chthonomonadaceae bacterium]|nr:methyltransferase domain-containing protein [Chthonomonadaceae bacterium]
MDKRLLPIIVCPACQEKLTFSGEESDTRLLCGQLRCVGCRQAFPVIEEVPDLVVPGANLDGAFKPEQAEQVAAWGSRNFAAMQQGSLSPMECEFVEAVRAVEGPVIDVASGPGGSYGVPVMQDGRTDRLLVMSDLGTPVMPAWRRCLRAAGWGERCSTLTFDARCLPFRDASVMAITSVGGFDNILDNHRAYAEAARVLQAGGRLLDIARFYEHGGPTYRFLAEQRQAAASRTGYIALLEGLGFAIERWEIPNSGYGKTDPADGLPLRDEEAWENVVIFARCSA